MNRNNYFMLFKDTLGMPFAAQIRAYSLKSAFRKAKRYAKKHNKVFMNCLDSEYCY